jgi:hypothetical protein
MRRYLQAMSLNVKALLGLVFFALAMALCVFIAAGTLRYWQGWLFLVVFFCRGVPAHPLWDEERPGAA